MCVIIHKPAGVAFPEDDIKTANENNPHGFGYVYYDPDTKQIIHDKGVDVTEEQILEVFKKLIPYEAVFHFRWRTIGHKTAEQAHPFQVLSKDEGDEIDMYFSHNGTITIKTEGLEESDTQAFNRQILKPILKAAPQVIEENAFHELLLKFIGATSKLVFMYGDGNVMITNPSAGKERHGCWVSNEHSFVKNSRSAVTTNHSTSRITYAGYQNRNQKNDEEKGEENVVDFCGFNVAKGSKVSVMTTSAASFYEEGEVTEVHNFMVRIKFTDLKNEAVDLWFDIKTGDSKMFNGLYYAFPLSDYLEDKARQKKTLTKVESSTKSTETTSGVEEDSTVFTKNGVTVDVADRYTGYHVDNTSDYNGITMTMLAGMNPEKQFEFFMENPEVAFQMFMDAVEYVALDQDYYEDELTQYYTDEELKDYLEQEHQEELNVSDKFNSITK